MVQNIYSREKENVFRRKQRTHGKLLNFFFSMMQFERLCSLIWCSLCRAPATNEIDVYFLAESLQKDLVQFSLWNKKILLGQCSGAAQCMGVECIVVLIILFSILRACFQLCEALKNQASLYFVTLLRWWWLFGMLVEWLQDLHVGNVSRCLYSFRVHACHWRMYQWKAEKSKV